MSKLFLYIRRIQLHKNLAVIDIFRSNKSSFVNDADYCRSTLYLGFDIDCIMSSVDGRGLGIFGMYERAALIGGKITVESQPGDGTTIYLEVPLKLS